MTGAMYAAIAGLRTHMQNLNVIGNNVANVNTYGYKSARSVFKTSLYTSLSGGSDGTAVLGGANPSQIGYGATMGSVGIDMSTGNYAVTGMATDLMLDGDGFFIMGDKPTAQQFDGTGGDQAVLNGMNLTRVGNFTFGADGYLAKEDDGMCVYGFQCTDYDEKTGEPIFSDQLVPIRYPGVKRTTTDGVTTVELVWPSTDTKETGLPDGYLGDAGEEVEVDGGNATNTVLQAYPKATFKGITIDKNTGVITGTCDDTGELVTIGIIAVGQVRNPNGVTNLGDNYYQAGEGSGGLTVALLGGAAQSLNFNGVVSGNANSPVYMNQSLRNDANTPGGGGTNDPASDISDVCRLRTGGKTRVLQNGLEMSKTDLAQEISQMILTQRGYQANTRIITVTDSMLEELVNMKR